VNDPQRRSMVRVKFWVIFGIFLSCWLAIRFGWVRGRSELIVFCVAFIQPVLVFFIRCEQCGEPLLRVLSAMNPMAVGRLLFPGKTCPVCGKQRI
jgi:hypothetical protein